MWYNFFRSATVVLIHYKSPMRPVNHAVYESLMSRADVARSGADLQARTPCEFQISVVNFFIQCRNEFQFVFFVMYLPGCTCYHYNGHYDINGLGICIFNGISEKKKLRGRPRRNFRNQINYILEKGTIKPSWRNLCSCMDVEAERPAVWHHLKYGWSTPED